MTATATKKATKAGTKTATAGPKTNRIEVFRDTSGWHWKIVSSGRTLLSSKDIDVKGKDRRQRVVAFVEKLADQLPVVVIEK